ncbi:MAG: peptidase S16 [Rhodobiaceae bacterium]|nr:MAG: peptidase S16 [Rhodobiaceae bacterium]
MSGKYQKPSDLPSRIPVFPLGGALLLPRTQLPLNIFEPRYLQMIDDALGNDRIIGMIQPDGPTALDMEKDANAKPPLYKIGCAGRITSFLEADDGRYLITLTGICRFRVLEELNTLTPYRQCQVDTDEFSLDLKAGAGEDDVSRERLLEILKVYLETRGLGIDWDAIKNAPNENLVNSLSAISPYGPSEKQALLEAKTLEDRNQMLIALTEMTLARESSDGSTPVQ